MKTQILAVSMLAAVSTIPLANASGSDGTINFVGAISAETCTISVNGGTASPTVNLPQVSTSGLTTLQATKGTTNLNFALSGCTSTSSLNSQAFNVFFQGGSGVNADGTLANTAVPLGATGVALQINDNNNTKVMVGNSAQLTGPIGSLVTAGSTSSGSLNYTVQYVSTSSAISAGPFAAAVTYSINYQ